MCLWSLAAARPCLLVPPPLKRQSRSDFHHFPNPPPWSHLLPVNFVSTVNPTSYPHWVNLKNRTWKIFWKKGDGKAIFVLKNMYIFPGKRSWVTHECQNKHSGGLKSRPNVPRVESPVWVQKVLCSYVVVELIVVVTTYKPLLVPTIISSFRSKTPLSKSTTQLEAVLKFVDSKCDFGLQIWRCNSFRCHLNPSHDGKLKPLFSTTIHTG